MLQRFVGPFVSFIGICVISLATFGSALAGAPFLTDDPDVADYQHFEFDSFSTGSHVQGDSSGVLPSFELDYGIAPNVELHINAPISFDRPSAALTTFGYGDTELGFKYRFLEEEKDQILPELAVYPTIDVPTGDQAKGLGAGHVRAFFPLWAQKTFGDWTIDAGGGYWVNQDVGLGDKNYWFFGGLLQRKITDDLTLGAELYHQTATNDQSVDSTGFNVGGVYDFDEHNHLLFSVGRGIQNASKTNLFSWYIGWQITR